MQPLYPAIKPYQCHELTVGELHVLYVEEVGNPNGVPVMVLHSGPGMGGDILLRRFFDPQLYRIIIFDQRGSGRSLPHLELMSNTTPLLLNDIETIRDYFGLTRMVICGGGWGALLALLYAQDYPQFISHLLLHQVFLARPSDIQWFYHHGANLIYPDYWNEFTSIVPVEKRQQVIHYYADCLQSNNELTRMSAAKSWALWKARCTSLQPHSAIIEEYQEPHFALALATLESHYLRHHFFIEDNQALANSHRIKHLPTHLIHGRYDMICSLAGAWELHQALPSSKLSIVRDAGHSYYEPGMVDAIIATSKLIARQFDA